MALRHSNGDSYSQVAEERGPPRMRPPGYKTLPQNNQKTLLSLECLKFSLIQICKKKKPVKIFLIKSDHTKASYMAVQTVQHVITTKAGLCISTNVNFVEFSSV